MVTEELCITHMQCHVFRMAQEKWKVSPEECARIFRENKLLDLIREDYGYLHLMGYVQVLCTIEEYLDIDGISYRREME